MSFAVLAFTALTACPRRDERMTRVDSPVKVDLVEQGGKFVLKLQSPEVSVPVRCEPERMHVAVASERDRMLYRCNELKPFFVVYFGEGGALFEKPLPIDAAKVLPQGNVDWSSTPPLLDAAAGLLLEDIEKPERIFSFVAKRDKARLASLLEATIGMAPSVDAASAERDAWLTAFDSLEDREKGAVKAALVKLLGDKAISAPALMKALDVVDKKSSIDLLAKAAFSFEKEVAAQPEHKGWTSRVRENLIHLLIGERPILASELGCLRLERGEVDTRGLIAVGTASRACPHLAKAVSALDEARVCAPTLACHTPKGRAIACPDIDLSTEFQAFVSAPFDPKLVPPPKDRALVWTARKNGLLPASLDLRLARTQYDVSAKGPECHAVKARGQPCSCKELDENPFIAVCNMATDKPSSKWNFTGKACSFEVDDKKRVIRNVKHRARATNEACYADLDCSPSERCVESKCAALKAPKK